MNRAHRRRLRKVSDQIEAAPLDPAAVDAAFELFRETGELPDYGRLAAAVVSRALRGVEVKRQVGPVDWEASLRELNRMVRMLPEVELKRSSVREQLLNEAIHESDLVRCAARIAIKILVSAGVDLTDPGLAEAEMEIPGWGSIGLHLIGFPDCIVKAPYKRQAKRLFEQFDSLRERIDRDDREWMDQMNTAARLFLHHGVVPDDELMFEAALANAEMVGLLRHSWGRCDAEVMATLDEVAKAKGAARVAGIEKVRAMVPEWRLLQMDTCE